MTSQKDQIQRLIAEIEATLAKPAARLPLGFSGDADRQRQLLSKLFSYLQSLDKLFDSPGGWGPIDPGTGQVVTPQATANSMEESASQVLQGLLIEMQYLRENSLKPMRQELETLQQKRDRLQAEINILEQQQGIAPLQSEQQINAFLETLMQRLQEQLSAQMVQNFAAMETATIEQLSAADNPSPLLSQQRLEQVRLLQAQSDQLLLKLDSTLTAVFDSLQKSVDSYRNSLEEGLNQMHSLGREGEVIFHAFINHLAQQLGQDASLYLTGELGKAVQQTEQPGAGTDVDLDVIQLDELDQALENLALEESIGDGGSDTALAIDHDLELLGDDIAPDEDITLIQTDELLDLELLEEATSLDEDITVIQFDEASELAQLNDAIAVEDDEDITIIQIDSDFNQGLESELDEDITAIQTDDAFDLELLEEATVSNSSEDDASTAEIPVNEGVDSIDPVALPLIEDDDKDQGENEAMINLTAEAPALLNLGLGSDNIDESLGLLATGLENSQPVDTTRKTSTNEDIADQDRIPQMESENELFSFDIGDVDTDLGLETDEAKDKTVDLLAAEVLITGEDTTAHDVLNAGQPLDVYDLADANQIADDWLFDQPMPEASATIVPPIDRVEVQPPTATVETLFGDSLATDNEPIDAGPDGDTIASLSELLPDEQTAQVAEDFPDNVPDDIYIAAAADEDLINLVESNTEQRLLIDFDDGPLVAQLDDDLQKLAGNAPPNAYGVEGDDALAPLDQDTLETIVRDLNLEDLDLDTETIEPVIGAEQSEEMATGTVDATADSDEVANLLLEQTRIETEDRDLASTDRDLFEGFATDIIDIDDPSAEDALDVATVITSSSPADIEVKSELPELVTEQYIDEFDEDEFDDGLSDSLADELGGLSEQSNIVSQTATEEAVGQFLSDLEESVADPDETFDIPNVDEHAPQLESASLPDVPLDFSLDDLEEEGSPEADDFLQAEQAAFWQTMAESEQPQSLAFENSDISNDPYTLGQLKQTDEQSFDIPLTDIPSADILLDAASVAASTEDSDDLDDLESLLGLNELPQPSNEVVDEDNLDLDDLDELFGQSSVPELEALDQEVPNITDDVQISDPLAELGLDIADSSEGASTGTEALLPELDLPPPMSERAVPVVEPIIDTGSNESTTATSAQEDVITSATSPPISPVIEPAVDLKGDWFLGLDVGATGLSAVLMNRRTGQVYPLYWQTTTDDTKHFRLPALAVLTVAQDTVAVGYDALGDLQDLLDAFGAKTPDLVGVNRLKLLLKVAVGHGQTLADSEPWLRWSNAVELPMLQVLQAMVALLKYLLERGQAVGLESNDLQQIWENLQGIIVGYPTNWPDTYSFNLREALLAAGLIEQPEQILFVEDAIATILSGLPDPNDISLSDTVSLSRQPSLYNCQWQEGTVVISGGAVMTELGLVNLPKDLSSLNYADFALRGFAYAGDALDQDIVCQLLLPEERRQPLSEIDDATHWDWQGHLTLEEANWSELDGLTLPTVGHVDWTQRYQLQQQLLGSSLGQSLLAAARHLKLALQQQNQIQITLAGQRWLVKRRHLENLIFLPYIQRINRYLNVLLSHHTIDTQAIKQVICTGGSASLPAIARWLRQKFPNATIIQDTYASELPHSCSRVAYGLVNLARYPQVLNVTRQQYSDYFLLMELLRVFPQQPLPVGAIMHLLEKRGINTQACHLHILALLEGHLPPGLVPTAADRGLICDRKTVLTTYRNLLQTPLFNKTVTESGGHIYIPNEAQAEQLRAYISRLLNNKAQTLEEPLTAQLETLA